MSSYLPHVRVSLVRDRRLPVADKVCRCPAESALLFRELLEDSDREVFAVLLLDARNHAIAVHTVSVGTINAALVEPRGVFVAALLANAAAVIGAHNHPSGHCSPSPEDRAVHERLQKAGALLDIPYLDSLVLGWRCYHSLTEGRAQTY